MPSTSARARLLAGAAAACLALTLSACSGDPSTSATPSPSASPSESPTPTPTPEPVPVSDSIDGIAVDGAIGSAPTVTIPAPFAIDTTRTRVLVEGDPAAPGAAENAILEIGYVGYNARTGEKFDSSFDRGAPAVMSIEQTVAGFRTGLTGAKAGDRRLIVMPGSEGYDPSGGNPQAGIEVGDTLVFVVDVIVTAVDTATGTEQHPNLPVQLGADDQGRPTVTIPAGATPPSGLISEPVIKGAQRAVGADDTILVKYRAYKWNTGEMIEDAFDTPDSGALASTIDAWKQGIAGQTIGSRVVLIAPNAYPTGSTNPAVAAGETVVYVVDILFASPNA